MPTPQSTPRTPSPRRPSPRIEASFMQMSASDLHHLNAVQRQLRLGRQANAQSTSGVSTGVLGQRKQKIRSAEARRSLRPMNTRPQEGSERGAAPSPPLQYSPVRLPSGAQSARSGCASGLIQRRHQDSRFYRRIARDGGSCERPTPSGSEFLMYHSDQPAHAASERSRRGLRSEAGKDATLVRTPR